MTNTSNPTYTILKESGCSCGQTTDFRLKIQPGTGLVFDSFQILATQTPYVTEVKVTFVQGTGGSTVIKHLCDAPVVCDSDQHMLSIITHIVDGGPDSEEEEDYKNAQEG